MTITPSRRQTLLLFRRPDCPLCDEARAVLQVQMEERVTRGDPVTIVREIDISGDADLEARYGDHVPVLAMDGHELGLATSGSSVRTFLDRALGRLA